LNLPPRRLQQGARTEMRPSRPTTTRRCSLCEVGRRPDRAERAAGSTIAAPSPCRPRIAIRSEWVVANAQASELAVKTPRRSRARAVRSRPARRSPLRDRQHPIRADYTDGVLTLQVPKPAEAR